MGRAIWLVRPLKTSSTVSLPITEEDRGEGLLILDNLDAITAEELEAAIASLPPWRREKALRFKHRQGRLECAFAYLLLCQALREVYGITQQPSFSLGPHDKPSLLLPQSGFPALSSPSSSPLGEISEGPHFNLSHCRQAIACVVSDHPVGVDVESIGRYSESLARHVLCDAELEAVHRDPDPQLAFTRLWTQKEALVKLTGRGIDDDLPTLLLKYNNVSFHTQAYPAKGYVVTVAMWR